MYPNLLYMLAINGISQKRLAKLLCLSRNSVTNKLRNYTKWKISEMRDIQDILKPRLDLDTLFSREFTIE